MTTAPKSRGRHARTMEHFRMWRIEECVGKTAFARESDVARWCESLHDPMVAYTQPTLNQRTPPPRAIVAQEAVEEALSDELAARPGVRMHRRSELVS
ncbi:FAD-dependent monooxygenase [Streptomyces sp. Inha503]|uniref:FAD-dependent monooxygenase n=1 Tax=Streptomyces sp. Inha503 TaxID=3383314 RepID=UPI00399F7E46